MEVDAFFTTDALNKRRMAFRARIEHVEGSLNKKIVGISQEHVAMLSKLGGSLDAVMQEISVSALVQAVSESFAALSAFTPDVDPAEAWDREPMLKRLAMLREQVRMLKEELRRQQAAYNELAVSHSSLLNFNNAMKATLWSTLSAVVSELRNRGEEGGVQAVLQAFREEWPSNVHSQQSLLDHLQLLNNRGAAVLRYSEDADDAIKELVANAVAEARAEERVKTKMIEEQLREYERSLPTRISEAVRAAQQSSKSNAALFERLKSEYEQHIDELNDLIETMKGEASKRVDETRAVVMHFSKASAGGDIEHRSVGPSSTLANRSAAEALLKQEELKLELLRHKMDNKLEQQALHRTLKAANQRLANIKPESVIVAEAQAPLIQEVNALKQQVLLLSDKASALVRDNQRSKELQDCRNEAHAQAVARLERTNEMLRRENEACGRRAFTDDSHSARAESGGGIATGGGLLPGQSRTRVATVLDPTDEGKEYGCPLSASPTLDFQVAHPSHLEASGESTTLATELDGVGTPPHSSCPRPPSTITSGFGGATETPPPLVASDDQHEGLPLCREDGAASPPSCASSAYSSARHSGQRHSDGLEAHNRMDVRTGVGREGSATRPTSGGSESAHPLTSCTPTAAQRLLDDSRLTAETTPRHAHQREQKKQRTSSEPPCRGSATVDAMVSAALAASRMPTSMEIACHGLCVTKVGKKKHVGDSSVAQDATAESMKPMALVKILLQTAALSAMLSSCSATSTLAPQVAAHSPVKSKDAGTQTRNFSVHPPPQECEPARALREGEPGKSDAAVLPGTCSLYRQRPLSGRVATRSVPTVQAVHKRSVKELSLLPQRMLLANSSERVSARRNDVAET